MAKLSRMQAAGPKSAIKTEDVPTTLTHEGAPGYLRDAKSELFTLAVANFVGEETFYEDARGRDTRYRDLVRQVAAEDAEWVAKFLFWLRTEANMRSASIVGAVEFGRTVPGSRAAVARVLQRPDEPGEALGYWLSVYGRPLPKWFKRALGDAALRLYSEFSTLKYDGQGQQVRFADVLELSQIDFAHDKDDLFRWILDRRHGREDLSRYRSLEMVHERFVLDSFPVKERRLLAESSAAAADAFKRAGMTWESVSGWLQGPMTTQVWENLIPKMGYMALLRNLRNFDQADVSDEVAQQVIERLTDPEQVRQSRQLPMRFLSAYNAAPSDRWKHGLGIALDLSLASIPQLRGETAVLIDTSGSMGMGFSKDGTLKRWDSAALFGLAFARANGESQVYSFSDHVKPFRLTAGQNTLAALQQFRQSHFIGAGTRTQWAVEQVLMDRPTVQRVLILTDEQASYWAAGVGYGHGGDVDSAVGDRMLYTFNLAGYKAGHAPSGSKNRHTFAGLSDTGFKAMSMLESQRDGRWPWE